MSDKLKNTVYRDVYRTMSNIYDEDFCKNSSTTINVGQGSQAARGCSIRKVFLKISQNSQENTCDRVSFLIKLQASARNFI